MNDSANRLRLIGKPTSRIDGREVVTGRAKYTHDVKLRGMLIGKILRSPRAAAEIVSIDLAPALSAPGVMGAIKLAEGKVRYAGQQVAAVAAVDERTAEKALALIKVEYRSLPFVVDWEKARDASAPQVRDGRPNVEKINEYSRGDVEKGFAEADVVVEQDLPDRLRGPQPDRDPRQRRRRGKATTSSSMIRPRTSTASATGWPGP